MFTQEEIQNLLVLMEAGVRAITSQTPVDKCSEIFRVCSVLMEKVKSLKEET
jgi:hypothetical protein